MVVRPVNFWDDKLLLAFGKNLRIIRKRLNFTQEELSYILEISLSQIARIETGKINPTLCTIFTIAKTLKVDPRELVNL